MIKFKKEPSIKIKLGNLEKYFKGLEDKNIEVESSTEYIKQLIDSIHSINEEYKHKSHNVEK